MKNNIRQFRKKKGLTQRQLAEAAGTSQQQIQRIESEAQAARFDLAVRISAALEEPLELVFPGTSKPLRAASRRGDIAEQIYTNEELSDQLEAAGLDMGAAVNSVKLRLRGGHQVIHQLPSKDKNRLWSAVQLTENSGGFIVYDTEDARVALNLEHLLFSHFLFDAVGHTGPKSDEETVFVRLAEAGAPIELSVEPDQVELDAETDIDWPAVQLQDLFFHAELYHEGSREVVLIQDIDGETAVFPLREVAMITVPLNLVDTRLQASEMEGWEEDDASLEEREDA